MKSESFQAPAIALACLSIVALAVVFLLIYESKQFASEDKSIRRFKADLDFYRSVEKKLLDESFMSGLPEKLLKDQIAPFENSVQELVRAVTGSESAVNLSVTYVKTQTTFQASESSTIYELLFHALDKKINLPNLDKDFQNEIQTFAQEYLTKGEATFMSAAVHYGHASGQWQLQLTFGAGAAAWFKSATDRLPCDLKLESDQPILTFDLNAKQEPTRKAFLGSIAIQDGNPALARDWKHKTLAMLETEHTERGELLSSKKGYLHKATYGLLIALFVLLLFFFKSLAASLLRIRAWSDRILELPIFSVRLLWSSVAVLGLTLIVYTLYFHGSGLEADSDVAPMWVSLLPAIALLCLAALTWRLNTALKINRRET